MELLNAISNAADKAVSSVADNVRDAATTAIIQAVEVDVEKYVGYKIAVEVGDIPSDWKEYIMKTGLNSVAEESSWSFLDADSSNRHKVELWKTRNIKKIILKVWDDIPEEDQWVDYEVEWESGWDYFIVWFAPHGKHWLSPTTWIEPGYYRYWNLSDEIVFALQLYQIPGKCFYKSDWLEGFEDVDPDGFFPWSTVKTRRWFQFRHWIIFWYKEARSGWNWHWTTSPPKLSNGLDFSLDAVLSLPSMPSLKLPNIKLPSLPDVSMPSMPTVELPSISAPSLSAPSLSMPSLGSLAMPLSGMPEKKQRPHYKYDAHGFIELDGLHVKASGTTLVLSNATITNFWQHGKGGHIEDEKKEHQKLELGTTSVEQAHSWVESLVAVGAKEGEFGGCCTVA